MPGICGIVGQPRENLAAELAAMAGRLRHHPWYGEERWLNPAGDAALARVTLGFVDRAPQPAVNEDGTLRAVLMGEINDYPEQRRKLAAAGHRFASDSHAELVLHALEEGGPRALANFHGSFTAAVWDAPRRRLMLLSDRFGMKPLYYAHLRGRLLFAPEVKALLADPDLPRRTSLRGVAQLFQFGQLLGDDTLLETVKVLPAAGCLTYDVRADRLEVNRFWRLGERPGPAPRTDAEALDRLDEAFGHAVDRCTRATQRLGLSLSGGLDARAILGAIPPGRPLTSLCMGIPGCMDVLSAAEMARLYGCEHHSYTLGADFLARYEEHLRYMVHLTDGHFLSECLSTPTLPMYRDLGIEVLLRGHAGELMHMRKAYNFSMDAKALGLGDEAAVEGWLLEHLHDFLSSGDAGPVFARGYAAEVEGLARDSLRGCLRESAGLEPPVQRIWHLFVAQRLRRETSLSMTEFGSVVETRLPFIDNELIDAILTTPPALKLDERIEAHVLRHRRPEFLRILNANTGTHLEAGRLRQYFAKLKMRVFAKLGVPGYQPYERLGLWLRRELRPLVEELALGKRLMGRGLFNPDAVRAAVEAHWAGRRNNTYLLMALMIFELGQREFLDGEARAPAARPLVGASAT
jgi:asparagine synthase (glutamine-hydrolysing)